MTIEDGMDFIAAYGESALLIGDYEKNQYKLMGLCYKKISLLKDVDSECAEGIRTNESNVKAIDSGRVAVEDGRQMIADAIARNERMLETCREIISLDDEVIALYKESLEIMGRLCVICDDMIDYYPRSIAESQAKIVEFSAKMIDDKEKLREYKLELKKARWSRDREKIADCKEDIKLYRSMINTDKSTLKTSRAIVKRAPRSLELGIETKERRLRMKEGDEKDLAEAEEAKRSDEKRVAEIVARIEELKAEYGM